MLASRIEEFHLTPAKPFHAGVVEHPYPAPLGTDMHQAFEMGVLLGGEEERHFEDTLIHVKPGDIWLCGAWEPHGWRASAPGARELVLQFLPEFLGEEMFEGVSWLTLFSAPPDQRPRVVEDQMREEALNIAHQIRREMRDRKRGWLASSTDLSVEAIADGAGFADASHLHHSFVQVYGCTPANYRTKGLRVSDDRPYTELEEIGVEDYEVPAS